ncbi:MAG: division/cell wall cluster transcriptional repressor MraZ [Planctomycetes bacterium]|nr:division/cell wall cluster transcriptional repressor MraZ [Planctomycetota bacterium]
MLGPDEWIIGEFSRLVDDRHRLALPTELAGRLGAEDEECILAKERFGCLSLWNAAQWQQRIDETLELVRQRIRAGRLAEQIEQVQLFGRLLSSRYAKVRLGERSRLVIPEGFRDFLAVEPNSEVMVIGAVVCVEIWSPRAWRAHLRRRMPEFGSLVHELAG